jgi:hypothetical protein
MTAKEALKGISEELKKLTPVPFEDTQYYQVLKDVIEELESIKSVDYNNTIKMLKGMRLVTLDPLESTNEKEREELLYARKKADKTNAKLETAINALHKAQAQEKELAELKSKVRELHIKPKRNEVGTLEDSLDYFTRAKETQNRVIIELKQLVGEDDE